MPSLYLLIPLGLVLVGLAAVALAWALGSGQYDELGIWCERMPDVDPDEPDGR